MSDIDDDSASASGPESPPASLRDMVKAREAGVRPTQLKAPVVRATPETEDAKSIIDRSNGGKKRDVGLRASNLRGVAKPSVEVSSLDLPSNKPTAQLRTHEHEIFDAIRRNDNDWIRDHAKAGEFEETETRQDIFFVAAIAQPDTLQALLDAGFRFAKTGVALSTAIRKENYPALSVFQKQGAQLEIETLTALARWRRKQVALSLAQRQNPVRVAAPEPELPESNDANLDPDQLEDEFANFLSDKREIPQVPVAAPAPTHAGSDLFDELDALDSDSHDEPAQSPRAQDEADLEEPDEMPPARAFNQTPPARGAQPIPQSPQSAPAARQQEEEPMTTSTSKFPASTAAAGLSALERAKLKKYDQLVIEKQQLEAQVMELEAYAEAAQALEAEREGLTSEIEALREQLNSFESASDERLAQEMEKAKRSTSMSVADRAEVERLRTAEVNLREVLRESEDREMALEQQVKSLEIKVQELENREPEPAEVIDVLVQTGRDAALRKSLFIENLLKGELKTLDKIAMNTSVDTEEASLALVFAAEVGQIKGADWIMRNMNGNVHIYDELPLYRAVEHKQVAMVEWLLAKGADMHHADGFALRLAARKNNVGMIDLLIKHGANPHAGRNRALREAFEELAWDAFRALLAHGAHYSDDKGNILQEYTESPEASTLIEWAQEQRDAARALDHDFAQRFFKRGN